MVDTIDRLKGILSNRNDIAYANRFRVEIPELFESEDFSILCRRVNMPGKQIMSVERRIGMSYQKIAYGYAVDDVNISFLLTGDMYAKRVFEDWQMEAVQTLEQGEVQFHFPRYKTQYTKDVRIIAMDKDGRDIYEVVLVQAYPTTVNAIEYSDDNDGILQLDVQLSYKRWYRNELG